MDATAWDELASLRAREIDNLDRRNRRLAADYEWLQGEIRRLAAELRQEEPESFLADRLDRLCALAKKQ